MKKVIAVVLMMIIFSGTAMASSVAPSGSGPGGGKSHKVDLSFNFPMNFYGGYTPGFEFEADIGTGKGFSIAPRIGFWGSGGLGFYSGNLGVSFLFGIIEPNRPTGFGIGPIVDLGLGSGYLAIAPGLEFGYKYAFATKVGFFVGGSIRIYPVGIVLTGFGSGVGFGGAGLVLKIGFAL